MTEIAALLGAIAGPIVDMRTAMSMSTSVASLKVMDPLCKREGAGGGGGERIESCM